VDEAHLAAHVGHLPFFITAPGQTDTLLVTVTVLLALCVLGLGALFLTVHSLPERIAHRSKKLQLEIVAVLCLLALFTHQHLFWVAALVLALIDFPDLTTPVKRMAAALERIAGLPPSEAEPAGLAAETGQVGDAPGAHGERREAAADAPSQNVQADKPARRGASAKKPSDSAES
jgi:multisubunit Na+/H+ antiporter MnhF subunit